jgi:pimeloyl-ACP methyl ester carboxylesterase
LTALELAAYADRVVDIAQGLGDQVVILGFSLGGVTTAWAAQNRSDIYRAVVISPLFGFKIVPVWLTIAAMRAYMVLPNSYTWWDPVNKDIPTIQTYTYPRYATRTLAQALKIGLNVLANARQSPFKAGSVQVITNANDELVNLEMIAQLTSSWKKLAPEKVSTYEFPASQKIKHDLFDPEQTEVDVVSLAYPQLLELATAP